MNLLGRRKRFFGLVVVHNHHALFSGFSGLQIILPRVYLGACLVGAVTKFAKDVFALGRAVVTVAFAIAIREARTDASNAAVRGLAATIRLRCSAHVRVQRESGSSRHLCLTGNTLLFLRCRSMHDRRVGTLALGRPDMCVCARRLIIIVSCMCCDSQQTGLVEVAILGPVVLKRWSWSRHRRRDRHYGRTAWGCSHAFRLGDKVWTRRHAVLVRPIVEQRRGTAVRRLEKIVSQTIIGCDLLRHG